jgi:GNAT superfamily N-acetyltransferase
MDRTEGTTAVAKVRPAQPEDLGAIVSLWRDSMAVHAERDPTFRPRADGHVTFERFVAAQIGRPDAAIVVAEVEGQVAAYGVCVLRTRPDYFEPALHGLVTDLDVGANYRRQGLGERVLDALCAWLGARGITRIEAEVVTANELSTGFWSKRGFVPYYQAMFRDLASVPGTASVSRPSQRERP